MPLKAMGAGIDAMVRCAAKVWALPESARRLPALLGDHPTPAPMLLLGRRGEPLDDAGCKPGFRLAR
jgi:hypothetical protein